MTAIPIDRNVMSPKGVPIESQGVPETCNRERVKELRENPRVCPTYNIKGKPEAKKRKR